MSSNHTQDPIIDIIKLYYQLPYGQLYFCVMSHDLNLFIILLFGAALTMARFLIMTHFFLFLITTTKRFLVIIT